MSTATIRHIDQSYPEGVPVVGYTTELVLIFPNGAQIPVYSEKLRAAHKALRVVRSRASLLVAPTEDQRRVLAKQVQAAGLAIDLEMRRCLDSLGLRMNERNIPEVIPGWWS